MRYTYVRQHDTTDCAAACLAMVCLHYKKEVTITRLPRFFDNNSSGFSAVLDFLFIFDHFQTNYASSNHVNCDNIAKKMQFTKFTFCDTIIA